MLPQPAPPARIVLCWHRTAWGMAEQSVHSPDTDEGLYSVSLCLFFIIWERPASYVSVN